MGNHGDGLVGLKEVVVVFKRISKEVPIQNFSSERFFDDIGSISACSGTTRAYGKDCARAGASSTEIGASRTLGVASGEDSMVMTLGSDGAMVK